MDVPLAKVEIRYEQDLILARRRARQIAEALHFPVQDQVRIATALSELVRNVFQYTPGGRVEFSLETKSSPRMTICVTDSGRGILNLEAILAGDYQSSTGMGVGLAGARRLVDDFDISSGPLGTTITLFCDLPSRAPPLPDTLPADIAAILAAERPQNPFEEMQRQNQELLSALALIKRQQHDLAQLNAELEIVAQRAEAASRAKTDFLAEMSHEIRTPMNAIIGLTRLLSRTDLSERQTKFVSTLDHSATSMVRLVNDLLDISKIEENMIELELKTFPVRTLLDQVIEMASVAIGDKPVVLSAEVAQGISTEYLGDSQRLHQILLNLVSNAVKVTSQGTVTLAVSRFCETNGIHTLHFSVTDTGIGMSQDALAKIFQKYVQADSSTTRRFGGTGLGLSIARTLAELMGGTVSATSTEGVGSVFLFAVPLAVAGHTLDL